MTIREKLIEMQKSAELGERRVDAKFIWTDCGFDLDKIQRRIDTNLAARNKEVSALISALQVASDALTRENKHARERVIEQYEGVGLDGCGEVSYRTEIDFDKEQILKLLNGGAE